MERTGLGIAAAEPDAESTRDNGDTYECDCTKSPHPADSPIGKKSRACGFDFHEPPSHAEGNEHQWWYPLHCCGIDLLMDVFTSKKRSEVMSRIRGRDTKPELALRSMLHRLGCRFTVNGKK